MVLKLTHKEIHQKRLLHVQQIIQNSSDQIEIIPLLNVHLLDCYDYILEHQLDLSDQNMLNCVLGVSWEYAQNQTINQAVHYLQRFLAKSKTARDIILVKIGSFQFKNMNYTSAAIYFKRAHMQNSSNIFAYYLMTQCQFIVSRGVQNVDLLKIVLSMQLAFFLNEAQNFEVQKYQRFQLYSRLIQHLSTNQFSASYSLFRRLMGQTTRIKEQFFQILHLLTCKYNLFELPKYNRSYEIQFQISLYNLLMVQQKHLYFRVINDKIAELLDKSYCLFEKSTQKLTIDHKMSIYKLLVASCQQQYFQMRMFKVRCLLNKHSDQANAQIDFMISQIKQLRFLEIKKTIKKIQQSCEQWIIKNIYQQTKLPFVKNYIKESLVELKQKANSFTYCKVFLQIYNQISILATQLKLRLYNQTQTEQINTLKQYGTQLVLKINKFSQLQFNVVQSFTLWTSTTFIQRKNYIQVEKDLLNQYLANVINTTLTEYFHNSDEHRIWEKIKRLIYEDYIPQNSSITFGSIFTTTSQYNSQAEIHQPQNVDIKTLIGSHTRIMKTYLQQQSKYVYLPLKEGKRLQLSSLSSRRCNQTLFLINFINQLQKSAFMTTTLPIQVIQEKETNFCLPSDILFFKLQDTKNEDKIAYGSTCKILRYYLKAIQGGTYLSEMPFGQANIPQFLVNILLAVDEDASQINKVEACLGQLRKIVKKHHFNLLQKDISSIWQKQALLQISQNSHSMKGVNFYIKLLLSNKISYQKFIDKMSSICDQNGCKM